MADRNEKRWFHLTWGEIAFIALAIAAIAAVITRLPGRQ